MKKVVIQREQLEIQHDYILEAHRKEVYIKKGQKKDNALRKDVRSQYDTKQSRTVGTLIDLLAFAKMVAKDSTSTFKAELPIVGIMASPSTLSKRVKMFASADLTFSFAVAPLKCFCTV